jgi:hypothetical protein
MLFRSVSDVSPTNKIVERMLDSPRLFQLARESGAYVRDRLLPLEAPQPDLAAISQHDWQDAKDILVLQRKTSTYYTDPSLQRRGVFRSKSRKAELNDTSNWVFTTAERFAALDLQIKNKGPVRLAQAILTANSGGALDVNQVYVANGKGNVTITGQPNIWLDLVAARNDVPYVKLLVAAEASQSSKDLALGQALRSGATAATQELLRSEADPNVEGIEHFKNAIATQDMTVIHLFLGSVIPLQPVHVNEALAAVVGKGQTDLLALLLAHGASGEYANAKALCSAISTGHIEDASTILLHSAGVLSEFSLHNAISAACLVENDTIKFRILEMLLCAGADPNTQCLLELMQQSVERDQVPLLELLIGHGTSPNQNSAESLRLAISLGKKHIVTVLLRGTISGASASQALEESTGIDDIEIYGHIVTALVEKGVAESSLHKCLANSIRKKCGIALVQILIAHGANSNYADADCICSALQQNNPILLGALLKARSDPSILGKVIPYAMQVVPQSERFDIMCALFEKGVSGREMHRALQTTLLESPETPDYKLMEFLVRMHASVDYLDENGNCVCIAAAQNDERALDILIEGSPTADTISAALSSLPLFLAESSAGDYEKSTRLLKLFLEKGATGIPVAEKLVLAVRGDERGKVLDLLLEYRADANFGGGRAIQEALLHPNIGPLQQVCNRSKLERATFVAQIHNALEPKGFSFEKASLLVHVSHLYHFKHLLDDPLLEEVQLNRCRKEVIELLVNFGASVDHKDGEALRHTVSAGDITTTRFLLPANPTSRTVARAFPAVMEIQDYQLRYEFMQSLLPLGSHGMGNQALVQATKEAKAHDSSHVEILLKHKASPNFKHGLATLEAVKAKNLPLLDLFVETKLDTTTLTKAFDLARTMKCSREVRHLIFASLFRSGFDGFQTSEALIEVVRHMPTDVETPILLLEHGASLDAQNAQAMQIASASGSLELLRVFIARLPSEKSRNAAFGAAIPAKLESSMRYEIYSALLETKVSDSIVGNALVVATSQDAIDRSLLSLLLQYNASPDTANGQALYNATSRLDRESLSMLLVGSVLCNETLNRSFVLSMGFQKEERLNLAKLLLEKKPGVSPSVISHYLGQIVRERDHDLLSLVVEYQPDPAYNGGESIILAAQTGDAYSTKLLTALAIPALVLERAFQSMLDERTIQSTQSGLQTANILLSLGIGQHLRDQMLLDAFSGPIDQKTKSIVELLIPYTPNFNGDEGRPFVLAACSGEVALFRRMAAQTMDRNIVIRSLISSFQAKAEQDDNGTKPDEDSEASPGPLPVEHSRPEVVNELKGNDPSLQLATEGTHLDDELGNDVNFRQKTSENDETAVPFSCNNPTSVSGKRVPDHGAEKESEKLSTTRQTPEEQLVGYLQDIEQCAGDNKDKLDDSIIFAAIIGFPRGRLLVNHLLEHGCSASNKIDAEVDPTGELFRARPACGVETLNTVVWALSRDEPRISDEVVLELLKSDEKGESHINYHRDVTRANLNDAAHIAFETSISRQSATTVSSAGGFCTILKRLIELGIDPSRPDSSGRTASFYASRNGHKDVIELLHGAGAGVNDGSLQEAAREAHPLIVESLVSKGHRIDFPSGLHADHVAGRTAIEELCLYATPAEDLDNWWSRIHKCLEQLLPATELGTGRSDGKTLLHLALENANPLPVTQALLEFPSIWESVNDPKYIFRDHQGYSYSPTKYVEHFCTAAGPETAQQLLGLLRAKKCNDKFYAHTINQPDGAVGLPEDIALAVDKQKREDYEHAQAVTRQQDLAARNRAIEAENYQRKLASDKERHKLIIAQHNKQEQSERDMALRKQALALEHARELQRSKEAALVSENSLKDQGLRAEATLRMSMKNSEQSSEIKHRANLASQETAALQARMALERVMIMERDQASSREADIVIDLLNRRVTTANHELQQRRAAANTGGY